MRGGQHQRWSDPRETREVEVGNEVGKCGGQQEARDDGQQVATPAVGEQIVQRRQFAGTRIKDKFGNARSHPAAWPSRSVWTATALASLLLRRRGGLSSVR